MYTAQQNSCLSLNQIKMHNLMTEHHIFSSTRITSTPWQADSQSWAQTASSSYAQP